MYTSIYLFIYLCCGHSFFRCFRPYFFPSFRLSFLPSFFPFFLPSFILSEGGGGRKKEGRKEEKKKGRMEGRNTPNEIWLNSLETYGLETEHVPHTIF